MTRITSSRLSELTDGALLEWLSPFGFSKADGGGVSRWEDDIYVYIACIFLKYGKRNDIKPFGQMGFRRSSQIYRLFMLDADPESIERACSMTAEYASFVKSHTQRLRCDSDVAVENYLSQLKGFVVGWLYPTLEVYSDPVRLVELYRERDESQPKSFDLPRWIGIQSALQALILARLYAPQYFDELRVRYRPILSKLAANPEKENRVERLLSYLEAERLKPLSSMG